MIKINNFTKFSVDKKFFLGVAKRVLKGENRGIENLSVSFISSRSIKKINKKYGKKDKPTDVLSFERLKNIRGDFSEIVICPEVVIKNKLGKIPLRKELAKALIHGVLHVLGYDHEKSKREAIRMEKREKYYFANKYLKLI